MKETILITYASRTGTTAGSAIQASGWLPEAVEFIEVNKAILAKNPFAIFTVCMTMAMKGAEKYRQGVLEWMEPVRRIVRPVKEGLFAGRLKLKDIKSTGDRIKFRISIWTGVWKEGDHRNWEEIRKWAESLKEMF
jgi:menaquinone-dependent protoporphyrinogen IX oxidase